MGQIECVGVVGAGRMGMGIAEVVAAAGFPTIVLKATPGCLDAARGKLERSLTAKVDSGKLAASSRDEILGRITFTDERERLGLCDLVIESIVEDLARKRELFAALDATLPQHVILASNTSTLRIGDLARDLGRATRTVGLHFFAPVSTTKLVELAYLPETRPEVVAVASALVARLGKTVVPVLDSMGFVVNRLLLPYLLGAIAAVEQGLALPEQIDTAMRLGCGHPIGPLALCDVIGLDVVHDMARLFHAEFQDVRYRPPALLASLVESGELGRKTGLGFFAYAGDDRAVPPRANEAMLNRLRGGAFTGATEHAA